MALQFGSGNRFHCDYEYDGSKCSWFADVEAFCDQDDDVFVVARQPYNFMGIAVDEKRNIGGFLLSFSGVDLRRDGISSRWIKFVIFTKEFPPINFEFRRFLGEECYYGGWSIAKEDEETVAFDGFARLNISEKDYEYDYNLTKLPFIFILFNTLSLKFLFEKLFRRFMAFLMKIGLKLIKWRQKIFVI